MLDVETLHPSQLAPADIAAWRGMVAAEPAFASPLMGPDFAQAVGNVREDARVAIVRQGGETVGFLPYHRRPGRMARAIGSHLSDYHGLISRAEPKLKIQDVLRAADLGLFRYTGLTDPFDVFPGQGQVDPSFVIALETSAEAYLAELVAANPDLKKYQRRERKLVRDLGPVRLAAPDCSREAFDQILAWKREQLVRTGLHDFLRPGWTVDLLSNLFETRSADFGGLMLGLYAGDRLVAGHFGVRSGDGFHMWLSAYDPACAAYSPGQSIFPHIIRAMPDLGLSRYDLGSGHGHYKRAYARLEVPLTNGVATAGTGTGLLGEARTAASATGDGMVDRLRRRAEQIASIELTVGGRVRGMVDAVTALPRRRSAG